LKELAERAEMKPAGLGLSGDGQFQSSRPAQLGVTRMDKCKNSIHFCIIGSKEYFFDNLCSFQFA
jgi:hypothetical protein